MLLLFPELDAVDVSETDRPARTRHNAGTRRRRQKIVPTRQMAIPYELPASQIRALWLGGRLPRDPRPQEIAVGCREAREADEYLNDGRSRDGYDIAVLVAEAAIRHAAQAIHAWSRRWDARVDRQSSIDDGRDYRNLLQLALLAWEWIEGDSADDGLMTFAEACNVLSCYPEVLREGIYRGAWQPECESEPLTWDVAPGLGEETQVDADPLTWDTAPGRGDQPKCLSLAALVWLGAIAGAEVCSRDVERLPEEPAGKQRAKANGRRAADIVRITDGQITLVAMCGWADNMRQGE